MKANVGVAAGVIALAGGAQWFVLDRSMAAIVFTTAALAALFATWGRRSLSLSQRALIVLSLPVYLAYVAHTPPMKRDHDNPGHLNHVRAVANGDVLPKAETCWECFQPPVYYVGAAAVYRLEDALGGNPLVALQVWSVALFLAFVGYGAATLKIALGDDAAGIGIATAILAFWPSGFVRAAAIGNDVMLYATMAAALYYAQRWLAGDDRRDAWKLVVASVLCVLSKSTGALLLGLAALPALAHYRNGVSLRRVAAPLAAITAGVVVAFLLALYKADGAGARVMGDEDALSVGNTLAHYATVDLRDFLTTPFTDPYHDAGGRQYFLNYWGKTALFGEWSYDEAWRRALAIPLSAWLVFFGVVCLGGAATVAWRRDRQAAPILCLTALLSAAAVAFRFRYPLSCANDFRYAQPVVIGGCLLFARALDRLGSGKPARKVAVGGFVIAPMVIGSVLFAVSSAAP
jgi:hypothetical protein